MPSKVALPFLLSSPEVIEHLAGLLDARRAPDPTRRRRRCRRAPRPRRSGWAACSATARSLGLMPHCSSANMVWKCVVETKGTPSFLPLRSAGLSMPEPLRTTSASASLMSSRIQKSCRSSAAAHGRRQRAGADDADLHVARGHRGGHLGAGVELAPVDLVAGRLLDRAVGRWRRSSGRRSAGRRRSLPWLVRERRGPRRPRPIPVPNARAHRLISCA